MKKGHAFIDKDYQNRPITLTNKALPLFKASIGSYPILNPFYKQINVADQVQRLDSPLNFYRQLLNLRKTKFIFQ